MQNKVSDDQGSQTTGSGTAINTGAQNSGANPAGTTVSGKSDTATAKKGQGSPNKRWFNPLSLCASYTYNISLYMVTPTAYELFNASGRKSLNNLIPPGEGNQNDFSGVTLICQSGGIKNPNSSSAGKNKELPRAEGFEFDYYIDNLKIYGAMLGKETQTSTNKYEMTFDIIEPMGFSFLTNLKRAQDELKKKDKSEGYPNLVNALRQFFVLGIRFKGYDQFGNIVTDINQLAGPNQGNTDQNQSIFERFFDIVITELKFKIDGRMTVYNVKAASIMQNVSYGAKRGIVTFGAQLSAGTVKQAVEQLFEKLNKDQKDIVEGKPQRQKYPTKYTAKFIGPDADFLASAKLVTPADVSLDRVPTSSAQSTDDSNIKNENSTPATQLKSITIKNGTPILQAVQDIVVQSTFMTDALSRIIKNDNEQELENTEDSYATNNNQREFYWYNVNAVVKKIQGFDETYLNDFGYEIEYTFQTFLTPSLIAPGVKKLPKYYGPHKRYEFYFTGKNTEVITYEQRHDNSYFNINLLGNAPGINFGGGQQIPQSADQQPDKKTTGGKNNTLQIQDQIVTNIYDPTAHIFNKLTIYGDPDYLMSMYPTGVQAVYDRFYEADGFTISPNGGSIFIEVNFFEASDYDNNRTGLLNINDKVYFFPYPEEIQKELTERGGGVILHLISSVSIFNAGRFTQELTTTFATFLDTNNKKNKGKGRESESETTQGNDTRKSNNDNVVGLKKEPTPVVNTDVDSVENPTSSSATPVQQTSNDDNDFWY